MDCNCLEREMDGAVEKQKEREREMEEVREEGERERERGGELRLIRSLLGADSIPISW